MIHFGFTGGWMMSFSCCLHNSRLRSLSAWINGSISRRLGSSAIEWRADDRSLSSNTENQVLIIPISSPILPVSLPEEDRRWWNESEAELEVGEPEYELDRLEEYEDMMLKACCVCCVVGQRG